MPTQLQFRRGTTAQTSSFIGATAELTVDSNVWTVVVHDGENPGGYYLARQSDLQNVYNYANTLGSGGATDSYARTTANSAQTTATGANGLAAGAFSKANTSLQNSGTQTLTGTLEVTGSISGNSLYSESWANSTNSWVSDKIYAGISPNLSTPLPNLIAQFSGNSALYVQVNSQNIDELGSADYVVTSDVGTDETFYIDLGIQNSQATSGNFKPLDGYLYVQGNTGQIGGNLIVGTATAGQQTRIVSGGLEDENVVISFNDDLSTRFYGNAIPQVDNTQYLGSSAKRWHSLYVGPGSIDIDGVVLSSSGGKLVLNDTNIQGNLTVTGTTFYANTTNLNVEDNIITLNSNVTGSPTLDAGIEINRGNQTNTVFKWSEAAHSWQFTNNGTNYFKVADTDRVNTAFALANTNAGLISIIQGVDLTQNTNITSVNQYAASGYALANTNAGLISIIQGIDTTQNTNISAADSKAQAAFDKANSGIKTTTSATRPTSNNAGDLWYSTGDDTLYQYTYDGTSNNWVDISGPILITSNIVVQYTITSNVG